MADNFGLKIGIEGEREFTKALSDIKSNFKLLASEMKLATSEFEKNDKSVEALTARNTVLNKEIDSQKERISTLEAALKNASETFGENHKRTQDWAVQLNNAKAALNVMERELDNNNKAISENNESLTAAVNKEKLYEETISDVSQTQKVLTSEMKLIDAQYGKNNTSLEALSAKHKILNSSISEQQQKVAHLREALTSAGYAFGESDSRTKEWAIQLNNAEAELAEMGRELENNNKAMDDANKKTKEAGSSFDKFKAALGEIGEVGGVAFDVLGKVGNAMNEAAEKAAEFGIQIGKVLISLGKEAVERGIEFESAFAGVKKTVEGTDEQFAELERGFKDLSKTMPTSAADLAKLGEAAGQLGIETDNILGFTKVIADLGNATNLVGEEGASELAKFANITGMAQENFDRLGSSIVALGNNFATTESDIVSMAMRLAGAGTQVGMSEAEIVALATAISSVGIEAEMGGSAISKALIKMDAASSSTSAFNEVLMQLGEISGISIPTTVREFQLLADNTKWFAAAAEGLGMTKKELRNLLNSASDLENFAEVSGMTGEEFKQAFEEDAVGALQAFLQGLSTAEEHGSSAIEMLQEMGLTEVRLRDSLLRAANAQELFADATNLANMAWEENTALANEANQRYETMESKIQILENGVTELGISFYQSIQEPLREIIEVATDMIDQLSQAFEEGGLSGFVSAIGDVIAQAIVYIAEQVPKFVEAGINLVESLAGGISENISAIRENADSILNTLIDGIKEMLPELEPIAIEVITFLAEVFLLKMDLIWNMGIEILSNLLEGISEKMPELVTKAQEVIENIVNSWTENLPNVLQSGIDIIVSLLKGIAEMLPELIPAAVDIILTLVDTLIDNLPEIIGVALEVIVALVEGLAEALPTLAAYLPEIVGKIVEVIIESLPEIILAGVEIIFALIDGLIEALPDLVTQTPQIVLAVAETILENLDVIIEAAIEIIAAIIAGLLQAIPDLVAQIPQVIDSIANTFFNFDWKDIGSKIISGISSGLTNAVDTVVGAAKSVANKIYTTVTGFFIIESPSKLFRDKVGKPIVEGMAEGIEQNTDIVEKAAEDMSKMTLENATAFIKDYRNNTDYLVDEEIKMWESLARNSEKGSKERIDIETTITKLKKQEQTQREKDEKEYLKASEQANKEWYDNAKLWIDNYRNDVEYSIDEEIKMWETLQEEYSDLSKERFEIDKNIIRLQEQARKEDFDSVKKMIDDRKSYEQTATQEIVAIWEESTQRYTEGTQNLKATTTAAIEELLAELSRMMSSENNTVGRDMLRGWIDGIEGMSEEFEDALITVVNSGTFEVRNILDSHSPSRVYAEIGKSMIDGLTEGIETKETELTLTISDVISETIRTANEVLQIQSVSLVYREMGEAIAEGLSEGIRSGESGLINAVSSMLSEVIRTANEALQIHSPSKVFATMGKFTGEGFIQGVTGVANRVNETVSNVFSGFDVGDITANLKMSSNMLIPQTANAGVLTGSLPDTAGGQRSVTINQHNSFVVSSELDIDRICRKINEKTVKASRAHGGVF